MVRLDATFPNPPLLPVDDNLAEPETRYEVRNGELVYVPPRDAPHATRLSKIAALTESHTAAGFDAAIDLLTRTSGESSNGGWIGPSLLPRRSRTSASNELM